jgi:hypothetical protein
MRVRRWNEAVTFVGTSICVQFTNTVLDTTEKTPLLLDELDLIMLFYIPIAGMNEVTAT